MKQLISLLLSISPFFAIAQNSNDWENPQIIGINKEQTTATFSSYLKEEDALKFSETNNEKSLNGIWKFNWVAKPEERPVGFYNPEFEIAKRDFININIDYKIHGVGGDDSWGAKTHKEYTIDSNKPISFGFIISPIK